MKIFKVIEIATGKEKGKYLSEQLALIINELDQTKYRISCVDSPENKKKIYHISICENILRK